MATNDPKISQVRAMNMFMAIRNDEMKNVRTSQYEPPEMVKRITSYIVKQANEAASSNKEADDE